MGTELGMIQSTSNNIYRPHRYTKAPSDTRTKSLKAGVGSIVGTIIPLGIMMKKRNISNVLKLNYDIKDMVILSAAAVAGGVSAGMIGEDKESNKKKLKEGVFQFMNASIPTYIAGKTLQYCQKRPELNKTPMKIGVLAIALVGSMFGVIKLANLIFDPKDLRPDRKLTFKDCLVNADDALGALVLAKFPLIDKLHVEKLLPIIYAWCGYRAGKTT